MQLRLDARTTGEDEAAIWGHLQAVALDVRVLFRALEPPIEDQIAALGIDFHQAAFAGLVFRYGGEAADSVVAV